MFQASSKRAILMNAINVKHQDFTLGKVEVSLSADQSKRSYFLEEMERFPPTRNIKP